MPKKRTKQPEIVKAKQAETVSPNLQEVHDAIQQLTAKQVDCYNHKEFGDKACEVQCEDCLLKYGG